MSHVKTNLIFLFLFFPIVLLGQSANQNYTKVVTYKQAATTQETSTDIDKVAVQVVYYDGLGRPIEQITHKQSPTGNDIITPFEYDAFGRQTKDYLPMVDGYSLNIHDITSANVLNYYSSTQNPTMEVTNTPYSEKMLENSPLGRVYKQAAPGDAWAMGSGHEIKFDYQTNDINEVRLYKATAIWNATAGLYTINLDNAGGAVYFPPNQLYKTITKDENWVSGSNNTTEEFKDKAGKVVLKKTYNDGIAYETYYVYDPYGNLTYVIPPLVNTSDGISPSVLDNLCYQYKYDSRNRLVEKKLPGKQWEYIVYNNQNMPVATGPAFSPFGSDAEGWMITKYDVFGRVVYTGWYDGIPATATGRKRYQNNQLSGWAENYIDLDPTVIDGVFVNYTNKVFPDQSENYKLLTINFYDSYNYSGVPTIPTNIVDQDVSTVVKGLATGSWVRVLTTPTETAAETTYILYDYKARVIGTYKNNYIGGYTNVDSNLDFTGKTNYTITQHKRDSNSQEIIVRDDFEYTPQDLLLVHKQQANGHDVELISKNDYDDFGKLIAKNVGGGDISNYVGLQKVDYRYNIRGWLKSINDVYELAKTNEPTDLFAFRINYNEHGGNEYEGHPDPLYNGNISETYWRTNTDNILRKYSYEYDALNRLTNSIYQKPGDIMPTTNMYNEKLWYDKNGNITQLLRNGDFDSDATAGVLQIDELRYYYDPDKKNQLVKVTDSSNNPKGFKDDSSDVGDVDDDYEYDNNGNMRIDANKNITRIFYNHLNLPTKINFETVNRIEYLYNAVGQKVQKKVFYGSNTITTDYLDGFQYTNSALNFFPHAEGYVSTVGDPSDLKFFYVYNYSDHLGNIRVSYGNDPSSGNLKILEENNYYPFGLKHTNYNSGEKKFDREEEIDEYEYTIRQIFNGEYVAYKYKYNGKEYQDELGLNMYDYGAMFYDPALGRRNNIDPKAETSRRWSPFSYCYNNPMRFVDPDGMQANDIILNKSMSEKERTTVMNNLQKLTNDELKYNKKTGAVEIASKGTGDKNSGTYLIRELINHDKTVTIDYDAKQFNSSENAVNEQNSTNGIGSDSVVSLGGVNPKALVKNSATGKNVAETQPDFIVLGHELSHSLGTMDGSATPYSKTYNHYFTNRYGQSEVENQPIEEYKTVGLDGFNRSGKKRITYPTENSIRKENKVNQRVSYSNGKL